MKARAGRRGALPVAVAGLVLVALTGLWQPAFASGWAPWGPWTRGSGTASGSTYLNDMTRGFEVKGTVRDYHSGDDCTYMKILHGDSINLVEDVRYRVCGGASKTFDYFGTARGGRVRVELCQDYSVGFDPCTGRNFLME